MICEEIQNNVQVRGRCSPAKTKQNKISDTSCQRYRSVAANLGIDSRTKLIPEAPMNRSTGAMICHKGFLFVGNNLVLLPATSKEQIVTSRKTAQTRKQV